MAPTTVPVPMVAATVMSLVVPVAVIDTAPMPPTVNAPLMAMAPAEAANVTLPIVVVVMLMAVIFPVDAVYVKSMPVKAMLVKSVVKGPGVTVYVVKPMLASKSMV